MADVLPFPDPWAIKSVPDALMAIRAASNNQRQSAAAIERGVEWVVIRTPQGMGRFRPEIWDRRIMELMRAA